MNRKINVYVNGIYEFSTTQYENCKQVVNHIRATKHLVIASVPENRYLTVFDYDTIRATYAK